MKRRTRLIIIGCAIAGTIPTAASAASATPTVRHPARIVKAAPKVTHLGHKSVVLRKAPAPLPKVTVRPGDTLSAIGTRTSRTWEQLATYNHVPNPNLIYVGQVFTIPPASYQPSGAAVPAPVVTSSGSYTPSKSYTRSSSTTRAAYSAPVSYTRHVATPTSAGSGIWSCIAYHESGGNPATNTGNGYYGMYQDTQSSWVEGGGLAYAARADQASAAAQTAVNQRIQASQGWHAWPNTSRMCGA